MKNIKMKSTYITLLVFCMGLVFTAKAQQEYYEYGFKGGVNLSNISGDVPSGYETRTSMNIGGYGLSKILPKLGIQAELLYSEQGFSDRFDSEEITIDEIKSLTRMQYVNLPVLVSYNVIEQLWFEGGFQFGHLVNAEEEREERFINESQQLISNTETIGQTGRYDRVDYALTGGLRYKLSQNFMVQARYTQSINDIDKELGGSQYNSVFSFSVGFVF
jgi:hypothetical protein